MLVSGSQIEPIKTSGLSQGDLLSSFLFTMVAEAFNGLMLKARESGIIKGLDVISGNIWISYLQFADDTLLFYEASMEELFGVKVVLRCLS